MKEFNLRDFYPWYKEDVIIEVTEEVAEELLAGQRYIKASRRRGRDGTGHYRRYPPGLGEHKKIFEKCSVSLLFLIFQLTRLMRGRLFPPTTE